MGTGHTAGGYWHIAGGYWSYCRWVLVILLVGTGHTASAGRYWSYCWWVLVIVMVGTGQPHPDGNSQGNMPNHTTAEFIHRPSFVSHVFLLLQSFLG